MQKACVIKKREEPTDRVNSVIIAETPKRLRICIHPVVLKRAIKREHFPMKTVEKFVHNMQCAEVFSKLDATSGYWQLKPDEESAKLCTFNTPSWRYSFLRVPFVPSSQPVKYFSGWCRMVEDIDGCKAVMDDLVVWGQDQTERDQRLKKVME